MYKAVLFDNDGTLVDTYELILDSMRHCTMQVLGREFDAETYFVDAGTSLETQMMRLSGGDEEVSAKLASVYRDYNESVHDERIALFPGVAEIVSALRAAGVKIGIVTGKRHALCKHGLDVLGLGNMIDVIVGPDDCPMLKPNPAPVVQACVALGVNPSEAIFIGDTPYDMQAGRAAGCATASVSWGMFARGALEAEQPDYVCTTAEELAEALGVSL